MNFKKIKKILSNPIVSIFLALLFTVLVVYIVFKDNYLEILELIESISPFWFIIFLIIVLGYHFLIGLNLKLLVNGRGEKYSCLDGFINALIASFGHDVTPSSSGGQVFQMFVFRKQNVSTATAAGALWADFIVYQAMMLLLCFIFIVFRLNYFTSHFASLFIFIIIGFLINFAVIGILFIGVKHKKTFNRITSFVIKVLKKIHIIKNEENVEKNLSIQLDKFCQCAHEFSNSPKVLIKCCLLQVLRLLLFYSLPFFISLSMNIKAVDGSNLFMTYINCICLSSYVSTMNSYVPLPGASGGSEAFFVIMFSSIFGKINASAMMALWRLYTYYLVLIIGALTFIIFKYFYKGSREG